MSVASEGLLPKKASMEGGDGQLLSATPPEKPALRHPGFWGGSKEGRAGCGNSLGKDPPTGNSRHPSSRGDAGPRDVPTPERESKPFRPPKRVSLKRVWEEMKRNLIRQDIGVERGK